MRETSMFLVREIMFCKPGKVRPLVEKFLAMNRIGAKSGMPKMRVMTDFCAERYWMLVAEMEVESMEEFEQMTKGGGSGARGGRNGEHNEGLSRPGGIGSGGGLQDGSLMGRGPRL